MSRADRVALARREERENGNWSEAKRITNVSGRRRRRCWGSGPLEEPRSGSRPLPGRKGHGEAKHDDYSKPRRQSCSASDQHTDDAGYGSSRPLGFGRSCHGTDCCRRHRNRGALFRNLSHGLGSWKANRGSGGTDAGADRSNQACIVRKRGRLRGHLGG